MKYTPDSLNALSARVLRSFGCDSNEAKIVADHLVDANLSGHDSHGIGMLPMYGEQVRDGNLIPNQTPDLRPAEGAISVVDAKRGFGHRMCLLALDHAFKTVSQHRVASAIEPPVFAEPEPPQSDAVKHSMSSEEATIPQLQVVGQNMGNGEVGMLDNRDEELSAEQALELVEVVDGWGMPSVVMGDFNSDPRDPRPFSEPDHRRTCH